MHAVARFSDMLFIGAQLRVMHLRLHDFMFTTALDRDDDNFVFGVVEIDTSVVPVSFAFTLCAEGKPPAPANEPAPETRPGVEGELENVPLTVRFTADDRRSDR